MNRRDKIRLLHLLIEQEEQQKKDIDLDKKILLKYLLKQGSLYNLKRDIDKLKKQLINKWKNKGAYENLGQKEIKKLKDKYHYNPYGSPQERQIAKQIDKLEDWAENYSI